jgi:outer membrane protein assembly factor BamB
MAVILLNGHILNFRLLPSELGAPICAGAVMCLLLARSDALDWPRLGGVAGAGVSAETGLTHSFPPEGPPVLWTVDVGEGFAGPAVSKGEVFLLDRVSQQQDVLRCFELSSGKELWILAYEAPGTLPYNGSRNVPTVDEQHVFTVGPFGHFKCIDRRSHRVVWSAHLVDDFKEPQVDGSEPAATRDEKLARAQIPTWGLTQAPLLYQDMVIVAPQTQTTGLVAYDQATGKIRWRSGYVGRNWYSHISPYLTRLCGVDQVIMLAQPSDPEKAPSQAPPAIISSVDPSNGKILWTARTPGPDKIPIAQPLRVGSDRLFITGGYTLGCLMLQVLHKDDGWETKLLFHNKEVAAHIHSPILYADRIYVTSFKEHGGARTGLVCLNTQGEPLWQTGPTLQFESGGYLIADGMAFVMQGKTGELCLLGLSPSGYELLGRAKVLEAKGANVWAPMALSDGRLLVRDQHQLKCLRVQVSH